MSNHGSSNLPSTVEEDHCAIPRQTFNHYTSVHPLAIGDSTFSRGNLSLRQQQLPQQQNVQPRNPNFDIAPKPSIYVQFKDEAKRLETFSDWPSNAPVRKEDLARNGFIYLHVTDRTQCAFCRGILSSWEIGDVVEDEHKRNCPECPLAFGYECGNKPIVRQLSHAESLFRQQQQRQQPTFNTTVNIPAPQNAAMVQSPNTYQHTYHIVRNRANEDLVRPEQIHGPVSLDLEMPNRSDASGHFPSSNLPSIPSQQSLQSRNVSTSEPKYPQWADGSLRVQSFMGWPTQMSQTPMDLAYAGLLYMGSGDKCKCYWCGGELYDWEPLDQPMEEHAKWFSHCNYVRNLKGDAYIQYVKDKQNGLIVEPSELMTKPHVLEVLRSGYTQEQIEEVVKRYGVTKLIHANDIIQAINQTNMERQARLHELNSHNSTQHSVQGEDDDMSMEIQESELNFPEQTVVKEATVTGTPDSLQPTAASQKKPSTVTSNVVQTKTKDVDTVLLENEKLKDQKLCKICMDRDLCVTFLPCSHLVTCAECSENLEECPLCRKKIQEKMRVFWS